MNEEDRQDFWNGAAIDEHAGNPTAGQKAGSFIKSLLVDIIIAVCLAGAVLYFIRPTIVKQTSMENTLHENDYMIMYRLAYKNHDPERGDIIIFQSDLVNEDSGKDKLLIKRVIGLPGDDIMIRDDQLYINGEAYYEDYLKDGYTPAFEIPQDGETYTVPEGTYFCMGDNRTGSVDSRRKEVGVVARESIKGKVIVRLFPFNKIKKF
ncbi:MAG: signal peptidase I [Mogibacterium sp.]|nr:signal peptidase I [Mogibacterium sp.]